MGEPPRRLRGQAAPIVAPVERPASSFRRRSVSVAVTVFVVPGLVATAALPAYASTFGTEAATSASIPVGQSLVVSAEAKADTLSRDSLSATSDAEMAARNSTPERRERAAAYDASGAKELGDDYPWPYEAADVEGGGLSPLGYYYRECVDFVAWRLNRDAGSTTFPFKYTWSNLTPGGGDASEWYSAWRSHGWDTGTEPVAGSVAWFNGNHVAYVKSVNGDGTVTIEEYNHGSTHVYGIRTIPVSSVARFLYAPPR